MITIERLALGGIAALLGWVTITVQTLAVDIAVLKNITVSTVSQSEFITFSSATSSKLESYSVWLSRLSDRINSLETKENN
jgi:hypothetical protein